MEPLQNITISPTKTFQKFCRDVELAFHVDGELPAVSVFLVEVILVLELRFVLIVGEVNTPEVRQRTVCWTNQAYLASAKGQVCLNTLLQTFTIAVRK